MSLFSGSEGGTQPPRGQSFPICWWFWEAPMPRLFRSWWPRVSRMPIPHPALSTFIEPHRKMDEELGSKSSYWVEGMTFFSQEIIDLYPKFESHQHKHPVGVYNANKAHKNTLSWRMESHTRRKMASYLGRLLQQRLRCGYPPCHPPGNNTTITDGPGSEEQAWVVAGDEEQWDAFKKDSYKGRLD